MGARCMTHSRASLCATSIFLEFHCQKYFPRFCLPLGALAVLKLKNCKRHTVRRQRLWVGLS